MHAAVLVIHLLLALAIVGLVLLQRSEGGGLGGLGGGGGGGFGGLVSPGGGASLLTRATAFCAAGFFATSLLLGIMAGHPKDGGSILDALPEAPPAVEAPAEAPAAAEPALPAVPVDG
jgi:preprotein translocase subunit SecG